VRIFLTNPVVSVKLAIEAQTHNCRYFDIPFNLPLKSQISDLSPTTTCRKECCYLFDNPWTHPGSLWWTEV